MSQMIAGIDPASYLPDDHNCFCGSSKKYLDCHKGRHYTNPNEIAADQAKFTASGSGCLYWSSGKYCGFPTVASHSLQRMSSLKAISENHHVLGFNLGPNARMRRADTVLDFEKISIARASTFPGFCSEHDSVVFKDIENVTLTPNYKTAAQLAYRAHAYETILISRSSLFLNWLHHVPTFGFTFDRDRFVPELENMLYYAGYCWQLLTVLRRVIARDTPRKLHYFSAQLAEKLPFTSTGSFCIETDYLGRKLQRFGDFGKKFNYAQFSILPHSDGRTLFTVSALDDRNKMVAREFIRSLAQQSPSHLADCALRTAVVHCENTYFSPTFIQNLTASQRGEILQRFDDSSVAEVGAEKGDNALSKPLTVHCNSRVHSISHNLGQLARKGI